MRSTTLLLIAIALALLSSPLCAQIVINEIMQNPQAVPDDVGEWFELYNPTNQPININGWTLKDDDTDSFLITHGTPLLIPGGGHLVLGRNADPETNGGIEVDYEYSGMDLANGFDELILLDDTLTEIDRVEWDDGGAFPDPNGESMEYAKDPGLDNNTGSSWCEGYLLFGDGDHGTPGEANTCCFSESCMYLEVDISTRETMRSSLHLSIHDHVRLPYTSSMTDTWDILELAEEDLDNSSNIIDVYKNATFPKAGGGNDDYDREHTWPRSYGFPDDEGLGASPFTDCHHLFLADKVYNGQGRSNHPYRNCTDPGCGEWTTDVNNDRGGPGQSNWKLGTGSTGTWETWPGRRGDVARAILYLDVRYEGGIHGATAAEEPDLIATDDPNQIVVTGGNAPIAYMGVLSDLIAWHEEDPPDAQELWRNQVVFTFQRNRNPFIDHPEWVRCVYLKDCGEIFIDGFESGDTTAWSQTVP